MSISSLMHGREVDTVWTNGQLLVIKCKDGREIRIAWLDDNGNVIKGHPVIQDFGVRLAAQGIHEIIKLPKEIKHG